MVETTSPGSTQQEVGTELLDRREVLLHDNDGTTKADSHKTNSADDTHQPRVNRTSGKGQLEITLTDQTNLLPFRRVLAVFGGLSLCALVSCLDSTIVATALPSISAAFNAGSVSSWVPSAYLLTSTAFQPLCKSIPCIIIIACTQLHQMVGSATYLVERRRCA